MDQFTPEVTDCVKALYEALRRSASSTEIILHTYGKGCVTIDDLNLRTDIRYNVNAIDSYHELTGMYMSVKAIKIKINVLARIDLKQYAHSESSTLPYRKCLTCKKNNVNVMSVNLTTTIYEDSCGFCNKRTCYSKWEYIDIVEGAVVKSFDHNIVIGTISATII